MQAEPVETTGRRPRKLRPVIQRPQKKICILGTTPSRGSAPFHDPSWEMWTIGPGGSDNASPGHRWERLFELHGPATWPRAFRHHLHELDKSCNAIPSVMRGYIKTLKAMSEVHAHELPIAFDGYLDLLKSTRKPKVVYTQEPLEGCEANKILDLEFFYRKFGRVWFTSQISYALAVAVLEKPTDIGIYGIDLESGEEYRSQFIGCRHFMDLARDRGINIHLPIGCGLMRDPHPYPTSYETHLAQRTQYKLAHLGAIARETRDAFEKTREDINRREGAIAALKGFGALPPDAAAELHRLEMELVTLQNNLAQHGAALNRVEGESAAFDFIRHQYIIHGDDPSHVPA
jgi:hypothetical protein